MLCHSVRVVLQSDGRTAGLGTDTLVQDVLDEYLVLDSAKTDDGHAAETLREDLHSQKKLFVVPATKMSVECATNQFVEGTAYQFWRIDSTANCTSP